MLLWGKTGYDPKSFRVGMLGLSECLIWRRQRDWQLEFSRFWSLSKILFRV
jgi:hypothetical protein